MAANTREIKRRIRSIDNTRQITKAMEMVAATKMRRAQSSVLASRAYADAARGLLAQIAASGEAHDHPLLVARPVKRVAIVLMTSDRGLCGAMNANVVRAALERAGSDKQVSFITVGKKGQQALRIRNQQLAASFDGLADTPHYEDITSVGSVVMDEFGKGTADQVLLVFPKFVSTLVNRPQISQLLPAVPEAEEETAVSGETLFEPSPEAVLESLVPRLVEIQLFQALLETKASEHSSRMMAMRNATSNASDLMDELKFSFNQARQAAITTEIAEIAAGS